MSQFISVFLDYLVLVLVNEYR